MAEAPDLALSPALDRLARLTLQDACERGLKLVTAEGCTGGLLAALLTDMPGHSHAFERGFVVHTDESKEEVLGVPDQVLDHDGAVSERCVRAMAEGALARSRGDLAVAITGFTDPGASADEPGGLVHIATARRGHPTFHRIHRFGEIGRAKVRIKALEAALQMLRARMIQAANAA